ETFKQRRQQLGQAVKSAQDGQRKGVVDQASGEDPAVRLRALHAEVGRLEDERESEIALAKGVELEAGIFISYGAAPEVATFEDHIFGHIRFPLRRRSTRAPAVRPATPGCGRAR